MLMVISLFILIVIVILNQTSVRGVRLLFKLYHWYIYNVMKVGYFSNTSVPALRGWFRKPVLGHVLGRHVLGRHVPEHRLEYMPGHMLRHVLKHVPE